MIIEILFGVVTLVFLVLYFVTSKSKRERIDFHGKHVLITGGSSGIGYELCIEAFKQGSHVSIIARNLERLNQIKNEIESIKKNNQNFSNQMVQIESVDIGKSFEETKQAIDRVKTHFYRNIIIHVYFF
jgi:NAD(P)-dependent dehydrogenase (short-subunit alcohol dehydrogenase family)